MTLTEIQGDILDWIRERLESKRYGTFGIEITLREGMPVAIEKTDRLNYKRAGGFLELTD